MTPQPKANGVLKITPQEWRRRLAETDKLESAVPLSLRGRMYKLEYTNRSIKGILADTGRNVIADGLQRELLQDPDVYTSFLYWGLVTSNPDITKEQVDDLADYRHFPYITTQIMQAVTVFMPDTSDLFEETGAPEPSDLDPTQ